MSDQFDENNDNEINTEDDMFDFEYDTENSELEKFEEPKTYSTFGNAKHGNWHYVYDNYHKKKISVFVYEKDYKGSSDLLNNGMIAYVQYSNVSMDDIIEETCVILKRENEYFTTTKEIQNMYLLDR